MKHELNEVVLKQTVNIHMVVFSGTQKYTQHYRNITNPQILSTQKQNRTLVSNFSSQLYSVVTDTLKG